MLELLADRTLSVDRSAERSWFSAGKGELVAERKPVEELLRKELAGGDDDWGEGVPVAKRVCVGEAESGESK